MKILVKWETYHEEGGSESQEMEIEQVEKDTAANVIERFFKGVTVDEAEREDMLKRITVTTKLSEEQMKKFHDDMMTAEVTTFDHSESSIQPIFGADAALNAFESIVEHYPELKGVEGTIAEAVAEVRKKMNEEAEEKVKTYADEVKAIHEAEGLDLDEAAKRIADWKASVDQYEKEDHLLSASDVIRINIERQTKKEKGDE